MGIVNLKVQKQAKWSWWMLVDRFPARGLEINLLAGALCIGWVRINFEVFHRGFPSYRGLIWFSCGPGSEKILKLKVILFQTLPWYLFNLRWVSHNFYEKSRTSETVSWEPLDFMLVLYLWEHHALPFSYQYALPAWYHALPLAE